MQTYMEKLYVFLDKKKNDLCEEELFDYIWAEYFEVNGVDKYKSIKLEGGCVLSKIKELSYLRKLIFVVYNREEKLTYIRENQVVFSALLSFLAQQYDIERVVLVLVLMILSKCDSISYKEGVTFLRYQERNDGKFGYLNPLKTDPSKMSSKEMDKFFSKCTFFSLLGLSFYEKECEKNEGIQP